MNSTDRPIDAHPHPRVDLARFIELLEESRLLAHGATGDALNRCGEHTSAPMSAEVFADFLVAERILTRRQCDKILDGKYKGFFIDEYVLLYHHHVGKDRSYYAAMNVKSRDSVILGVQPKSYNRPGDDAVYYDVFPLEDE